MSIGYGELIDAVLARGRKVAPRGYPTFEIPDCVLVLEDPRKSLPIGINRKLNTKFAAVEAIQIVGGFTDPQMLLEVNPRVSDFIDGGVLHGAYGPRLRPQMAKVIERLRQDQDTRQALATIWDPARDLHQEGIKDVPCTLFLDFMIRDNELELHTTMRSNDVWWGVSYDVFCFTQLQIAVASAVGVGLGAYFHHAVSMHIYERDIASMSRLTRYDGTPHEYGGGLGFGAEWDVVRNWITDFAYNRNQVAAISDSEKWYAERLPAHTAELAGDVAVGGEGDLAT